MFQFWLHVIHQEDVAVPGQVEPAIGQGPLGPPRLDHQQGDVGPPPSQLVGDPREDIDPLLERGIDERDVTRIGDLGPDPVEVD